MALVVALVVFAVAVPVGTAAQGGADVAGSENRVGTVVDPGDSSGNTSTAGQRADETGVPDPSNEGQSGVPHSVTHPLDPTPTLEQPDGTTFEARFWSAGPTGGWRTVDGYTVLRGADGYWYYATRGDGRLVPGDARVGIDRVPASVPTGLAPSVGTDSAAVGTDEVPPTGTQEIPVVAINFSDTTKSYAPSEFQSLLFGDDPNIATGPGSVTDYYEENSGGQLTLTGDVSGWETADNGESYYGDGGIGDGGSPTGAAELVKEAAQKADDQVDFAQYDNDDDCQVDQFATIHQGGGQETTKQTEDIWSHRWSLASGTGSKYATDDSSPGCSTIYVNGYTIQPETYGGQIATIGVYAHEFGHGLGLPDLYDTDGSSAGIGEWGLMGSGSYGSVVRSGDAPNHMTAWTKAYLGWLNPPTVATGESQDNLSLANVSKNNEYLRLLDGSNNPNGEYFYVANRQRVGFDQGLPGEGLLVTHINESRLADDCVFSNSCNDDENNKLVDIEAADGNGDLDDNTNRGDAGDPWDEGTGPFDGDSTPSSDYDDGSSSNVTVSAIGFSAGTSQGTATFDASVPVEMFDVTITSVDSTVTEGETITVAYEVTNTGDVADTQDIGFAVNGTTESTEPGVTLNGSETFSDQFTYDTGTGDAPAVSVAVSSADDSASATVTVNEPSSFDVTITSVDSAVAEGETITVVYEVQNTGDVTDTQDIGFAVNGTTEDTEAGVTLNGSETFSGQFSYTTGAGDAPAVSVAVSSADDSASETVTVNEPASFDVTVTSVDSAVTEGETITVAYEVTNTGDAQDTQDITFAVNGTTEDTESGVTLNGSETFSGQFTYQTVAGDTPTVTVAVSSADDSASEIVTVNNPASFDVTVTSVDSAVTEGETITVAYEVTNTGGAQDTQDITFAVNGTTEDTESGVTLNGGETFSGQFTYDTVAGDAPAVSVAVLSADDSASETVTVNEPASFDVTITSVDSAVTAGETITVAYEVTNTGDQQGMQDITFAVNGTTEDTESGVTLNGSETFSNQLTYDTAAGDAPAVNVAVLSADDSASETVTVNEPASFDVTVTSIDSAVTAGETITVAYEVTNTGDQQGTQDITFAVNGTTEDTESGVTLNGSETFSGQFTYQTVAGDAPAVNVAVSSADDSSSSTVTVNEPANFDVTLTSVDSAVTEGETITVAYEVTNTGGAQDTQDIIFAVNGTTEDTESGVTLNGSETFSNQFTYDTVAGDAPAVSVAVSSADDTASDTVTINEPANFDVTITSVDSAVTEGETVTLAYEVTNTGDAQDTQDITFAVNGTTEDTESGVTLNGSETFSGQFSYTTGAGDAPAVSVAVSSADDSSSSTVTVNEPASFDVTLTSVDSAVTEGETMTLAYEVTNTGDQQGMQDITFAVNGTTEDTESGVTLSGNETFSGQFTYDTVAGDAPAVSVAVSSADDSDSNTVTVNEPSSFVVEIVETNTPVEGESLNVTATVENTGDVEDTQSIDLSVGPLGSDSTAVTLAGGASTNVTFSVSTGAGDAGGYTATVSSADDSASANVTVLAQSGFQVNIIETNTPVEGQQLNVTATIENTGDVEDTQMITLDVGPLGTDSTQVTLGGGASTNVTLSTGTGAGDAGEYTATVASADDAASATVSVLASAEFVVSIVETTTPVEGDSLTVTATVQNTGDVEDTQTVTLDVGALGSDSTAVTLAGDASTNVTLSVGTGAGDAGEYTATAASADDAASANVTVLAPAEFVVSIVETTTPVEGEQLNVTAQVRNTGDVQDTQTIELSVGALGTDSTVVTLGGGASTNVTLSVGTGAGDAGEYTATVSSADDAASANVTVLAPAEFAVAIVETNTPVEGEQLNVTATIENTGDVQDTQTVTLDVGPLGTDSTAVTLAGGASTNVTLSVGTGAGDAGAYTATVSSANATTSANVTVLTPAQFVVSNLTAPAETTVGASINVSATVTNTGGTDDTQDVAFRFDGTTVSNTTVELDANESTTVVFSPTLPDDPGTYEHGVFTDDDNQTAEITVVDPDPPNVTLSNLRIAGDGDNATVMPGNYDVSVELSHDGGPNGTVPMELTIGNATTNETVSLNASEIKTVTFENATGGLSPAVYNVTVSTVNTALTGELTLSVDVGGSDDPATDTDGDGRFEDVDGDSRFDITDVQALFDNLDSDPVQNNPAVFNFAEDANPTRVSIFDVQALFENLVAES